MQNWFAALEEHYPGAIEIFLGAGLALLIIILLKLAYQ